MKKSEKQGLKLLDVLRAWQDSLPPEHTRGLRCYSAARAAVALRLLYKRKVTAREVRDRLRDVIALPVVPPWISSYVDLEKALREDDTPEGLAGRLYEFLERS